MRWEYLVVNFGNLGLGALKENWMSMAAKAGNSPPSRKMGLDARGFSNVRSRARQMCVKCPTAGNAATATIFK